MAVVPTGFYSVSQTTGWIEMELSSSWAAFPSSLKRFCGLPMACPTPSALQTISACWPASAWKSPPHDGPQGKRASLPEELSDQRLWKCPVLWKLMSLPLIPSCPWLDFLQACPRFLPVVPALPQPLPDPLPRTQWPWERQKGGVPLPSMYPALPLDF